MAYFNQSVLIKKYVVRPDIAHTAVRLKELMRCAHQREEEVPELVFFEWFLEAGSVDDLIDEDVGVVVEGDLEEAGRTAEGLADDGVGLGVEEEFVVELFDFFDRLDPILELLFVVDGDFGFDEVGVEEDFGVFKHRMVD